MDMFRSLLYPGGFNYCMLLAILCCEYQLKGKTNIDTLQLHAMGVWAVPWEERVMREANTFWFYALCFSLTGTLYALLSSGSSETRGRGGKKKNARKSEKVAASKAVSSALWMQLLIDGCDLLIPAELLNWMPTGDLVIGSTMILSTLLAAGGIWARV